MDRDRYSAIAHRGMPIWNPIGLDSLLALTARCGLAEDRRVLDVGCGRAELLLSLIEQHGVVAVGVEPSPRATEVALAEADARDPGARLHLQVAAFDASLFAPASFDLVACLGATHACGSFADTLAALAPLARPGGHLLIGEGYWRRKPDQEYLAFLGCTEEELTPLEGFAAAGEAQGLAMVAQAASSDEEWDAYEGGYEANMRAHLADHPDDPDAEAFRERMESWSEALRRWGRTTLGFAATLYRRGP
ncbi:MAG: SAM-dependent methyltransferase [Planctomycetota bacterium]